MSLTREEVIKILSKDKISLTAIMRGLEWPLVRSELIALVNELVDAQATIARLEDEVWKAHVPVTGTQHDPANGLLHGYCIRCREVWPCQYSPESHMAPLTQRVKELEGAQ